MRSIALMLGAVALVLLMTGCPKRPGISVASAPPPAAPAPAPAAPAPTPAPVAAAPAPAPPAPTVVEEYKINDALRPVYFAFDSSKIRPADARTLDASADWLKAHPDQLTLIEGHCDERGTNEYNLALGERRANAAMSYLVSRGIEARRISIISYGKERPVCADHTEACWAKNRRDVFLTKKG
jgi:peptidoglycan-associated lipoprotein